ncbi:hypothetical protein [Blastococcus xanthinilyticus]|nr:hypothetical protein [Blastococcus xanthinilyticus]
MDDSAAWLLVGAVLGVLAVVAVALCVAAARVLARGGAARRRPGATPRPVPATAGPVDDLADFLEHPPGTRPAGPGPAGWAALAPPPPAPAAPPARRDDGRRRALVPLAAGGLVALAVVGTAAAVVAGSGTGDRPPAAATRPREGAPAGGGGAERPVVAELSAAGLVLEPRAVGITAAYPELRLGFGDGGAQLDLRLPTYNCLTTAPPPDPVAAGCAAAQVEHASLSTPRLRVERNGEELTLRGEVATSTRPGGSPPEPTGRVYDLELTLAPGGGPGTGSSFVGELTLGSGTAPVAPAESTGRTPD